jgi:hypothetical protein
LIVRVRQAVMTAGQPDLRPAQGDKAIGPRGVAFLPMGSTLKGSLCCTVLGIASIISGFVQFSFFVRS